jgi:RHS repeat-associated protein
MNRIQKQQEQKYVYALSTHCTLAVLSSEKDFEADHFFYHSDHLGSSSWISDASGNVNQHLQYMPFGESFVDQRASSWVTPYTFSAKEKDLETGYSYFGARYYDASISVWLSVDPMSDYRQGISSYNYCQWNPVVRIDPTGAIDGWIENGKRIFWDSEVNSQTEANAKYGNDAVHHDSYIASENGIIYNLNSDGSVNASHGNVPYDRNFSTENGITVKPNLSQVNIYSGQTINNNTSELSNTEIQVCYYIYMFINSVNFWSDLFGGPSGSDADLAEQTTYLASMFLIAKAKLPSKGSYNFKLSKRWKNSNRLPTSAKGGYIDKYGNVWKRPKGSNIQGETHWDVTLSNKGKRKFNTSKNHLNVNNNGEIAH